MSVTLYGIKNCDTIKKAKKWLNENGVDYCFHDFRVDGIDRKLINGWFKQVNWEVLLNTRGTSWRKLPDVQRENINKTKVLRLMLENPAIIKRPVLCVQNKVFVGFKEETYEEILS